MDQIKIGTFLKSLRLEKELTQEELAEKFNVSNRTVSRWECGINMPDLGILVELAEFYSVDVGEILNGERKNGNMDNENTATENRTSGTDETIGRVIEYADNEKRKIKRKFRIRLAVFSSIVAVILVSAVLLNLLSGHTRIGYGKAMLYYDLGRESIFSEAEHLFGGVVTETIYYSLPPYEDLIEEKIRLGKKEETAFHLKSDVYSDGSSDNWYGEGNGIEYLLRQDLSYSIESHDPDVFLKKYTESKLTEESLIKSAEQFLSEYIDGGVLSNLDLKIKTELKIEVDGNQKVCVLNGIYSKNDYISTIIGMYKVKSVLNYTVIYSGKSEHLRNDDEIKILFDNKGNIKRLDVRYGGVDWSSVTIDETAIEKKVDEFIRDNVDKRYTLIDYTIGYKLFSSHNGKAFCIVGTTVHIEYDGEEKTSWVEIIVY